MESLLFAIAAGVAQGLITWGALRVEMRYLRRDVDLAHDRLNKVDERCIADRRQSHLSAGRPL